MACVPYPPRQAPVSLSPDDPDSFMEVRAEWDRQDRFATGGVHRRVFGVACSYRFDIASPTNPRMAWVGTALSLTLGSVLPTVAWRVLGVLVPTSSELERCLRLASPPLLAAMFAGGTVLVLRWVVPVLDASPIAGRWGHVFDWTCHHPVRIPLALMVGVGLAPQIRAAMAAAARIGAVSPRAIRHHRWRALLGLVAVGVVAGAGFGAIGVALLAAPLHGAYEVRILLADHSTRRSVTAAPA